jgi:hypothetical protein
MNKIPAQMIALFMFMEYLPFPTIYNIGSKTPAAAYPVKFTGKFTCNRPLQKPISNPLRED